ncbi:peptidoglycan DD-metalloendopeptidase family protein [Butyrivibrio sp. WCD3002]|uniref:peptidoglycan DD-metalloendopeptidase family protein n=1 Tax=Butyrivibrio sp. WCD3002 TaxID=1280676 RepID=UPI00047B038A|nr:peptidoglycan DD-metalloendopeptidase family protein [Butyrivibrio sp. WCD3002]
MSENNRPKKHRHKRHYTFMIISGDSDGSSGSFHLGHVATQVIAFSIFGIIVALICFLVHSAITVSSLKKQNAILVSKVQEIEAENKAIEAERSELESEVSDLSMALNRKVEAEAQTAAEEEEASMPTFLPVSNGTASMVSTLDDPNSTEIEEPDNNADEDADEGDDENAETEESSEPKTGDPILIITAEKGATVTAAGSGTVTAVAGDIKYGNSITIDHGNGYVSIYRNAGDSLVHEGDAVTPTTTLMIIGDDNTKLGYQIQYNGEFIDPEDVIEING